MIHSKYQSDRCREIGQKGEDMVEDRCKFLERIYDQKNGESDFMSILGERWECKTLQYPPCSEAWYPLRHNQKSRLTTGKDWLLWVILSTEKIYFMRYDGTIPQFKEFREFREMGI
jgi:hypothetical protein